MTDATSSIDPRHTALLVMDYQAGILERLEEPEPLLARAADAIEIVRRQGGQIGYVRVAFEDADYQSIPSTSAMARVSAAGRALHVDSPATAIHQDIAPKDGDIVVRKTRVGAFSTTDVDEQLHKRCITTLFVAGISTSGVVLSTVRDAADRDYQVLVLTDATGDADPGAHEFLTEKIFPRQARMITTAELEQLLSS